MAASNDLTGNNPAATFSQLLHIGTGTASVSTVRIGNGAGTALSFVSGGVKVTGTFEATGNATVGGNAAVIGDAAITGSLTLGGVGVFPTVYKMLTADVSAPGISNVNLTEFDFTPVSGATYEVEFFLTAQSVNPSVGAHLVNTGGAGALMLTSAGEAFGITAAGGIYAPVSVPAINTNFGIFLKGYFSATSSAALTWAIVSRIDTYAVMFKTGSILKITRIS